MGERIFLIAQARRVSKARRTNAELTNVELEHRIKRASPATRALHAGSHFNPIAGGAEDLFGSERGFRVQRGASFSEARQMQDRSQRSQVGALAATAGGILAGEKIRNPRNALNTKTVRRAGGGVFNKPKLKELARSKKVVGGTAVLAAGTGYSKYQGRQKGKTEDAVWDRMVAKRPRSRGL